MMRQYRVLHNFDAQDSVELTVKKGEEVSAMDGNIQDGWIKVEVVHDSQRRGFVPFNYLREASHTDNSPPSVNSITAPAAQHHSTEPPGTPSSYTSAAMEYGETLHHTYGNGGAHRSSGSHSRPKASRSAESRSPARVSQPTSLTPTREELERAQQRLSTLRPTEESATHALMAHATTNSASNPRDHQVTEPNPVDDAIFNDPNAIIDAFMKNELHFKQLMRQRQDALTKMRSTLEETVADLGACKEKNAVLASKLRDLDETVERERRRWKERIEEEKSYINRSIPHDQSASANDPARGKVEYKGR